MPFVSQTHGEVKEYPKSHLNILEVCTVFIFFNILVETVKYGKDSERTLDQRPMEIRRVNAQHQNSVLLYFVFFH